MWYEMLHIWHSWGMSCLIVKLTVWVMKLGFALLDGGALYCIGPPHMKWAVLYIILPPPGDTEPSYVCKAAVTNDPQLLLMKWDRKITCFVQRIL